MKLFSLWSFLSYSLSSCILSNWSFLSLSLAATTSLLSCCLRSLSHVLVKVNKLDECDFSSITLTSTQLDNTCITTRTISYLLCNLTKESLNSILVLKITENNTT